jgi:hypothetical protein
LLSSSDDHRRHSSADNKDTSPPRAGTIKNFPVQEYPSKDSFFEREDVRVRSTLREKSGEMLMQTSTTFMKMKSKTAAKEIGIVKQSKTLSVARPKIRREQS